MVAGGSPRVNLWIRSSSSWRSSIKKRSYIKICQKKVTLAIWHEAETVYPVCPALTTGTVNI